MSRASVGTAAPISVGAGIGATEGAGLGRAWGSSSQPPTARIVMASSAGVLVSTATVTRQNQARGRDAVCDVGLLVREPNQRDVEPRRGRLNRLTWTSALVRGPQMSLVSWACQLGTTEPGANRTESERPLLA